ncbi:AAA family ATPase [bacterium]|nr:AAA family ATPase [bacterium]
MKNQENEQLRQEIQTMVDAGQLTIKALSTVIGKSPATASLWLAGKYSGDNDSLTVIIQDWIERQKERKADEETGLLLTSAFDYVTRLCRTAHSDGGLHVAYGEAGVGKTESVRHYASKIPNVILVEVDPSFTTLSFMQALHKLCGMSGTGSLNEVMNDLVSKLRGSSRLVIIDEAEYLPKRALDLVRSIYDRTGIGILLVGMPKLMSNLMGKNQDFRQLYSRIDLSVRVESCTDDDVQQFVNRYFPNSNGIWKHFAEKTRNARSLNKLLKQTKRMCEVNEASLNKEIINEATKYVLI